MPRAKTTAIVSASKYGKMTNEKLREMLTKRKLSTGGGKPELVARLEASDKKTKAKSGKGAKKEDKKKSKSKDSDDESSSSSSDDESSSSEEDKKKKKKKSKDSDDDSSEEDKKKKKSKSKDSDDDSSEEDKKKKKSKSKDSDDESSEESSEEDDSSSDDSDSDEDDKKLKKTTKSAPKGKAPKKKSKDKKKNDSDDDSSDDEDEKKKSKGKNKKKDSDDDSSEDEKKKSKNKKKKDSDDDSSDSSDDEDEKKKSKGKNKKKDSDDDSSDDEDEKKKSKGKKKVVIAVKEESRKKPSKKDDSSSSSSDDDSDKKKKPIKQEIEAAKAKVRSKPDLLIDLLARLAEKHKVTLPKPFITDFKKGSEKIFVIEIVTTSTESKKSETSTPKPTTPEVTMDKHLGVLVDTDGYAWDIKTASVYGRVKNGALTKLSTKDIEKLKKGKYRLYHVETLKHDENEPMGLDEMKKAGFIKKSDDENPKGKNKGKDSDEDDEGDDDGKDSVVKVDEDREEMMEPEVTEAEFEKFLLAQNKSSSKTDVASIANVSGLSKDRADYIMLSINTLVKKYPGVVAKYAVRKESSNKMGARAETK